MGIASRQQGGLLGHRQLVFLAQMDMANAQRMNCDLSAMPTILRINDACLQLPAFIDASPAGQPDAE